MREALDQALANSVGVVEVQNYFDLSLSKPDFFANIAGDCLLVGNINTRPPSVYNQASVERHFRALEWSNLLFGIAQRIPSKHFYNHPVKSLVASSKPLQLSLASEIGLRTPATLITDDVSAALDFIDTTQDVICKPIDNSVFANPRREGDTLLLFTRPITRESLLASTDGKKLKSPTIFQERIAKNFELRIVLHADLAATFRIDSQKHPQSRDDWRLRQTDSGMFSCIQNNPGTITKLSHILETLGLDSGVFDMAVDEHGNEIFFECNPNGQWFWLDSQHGGQAMNNFIISLTNKFADISLQ
jgi:hypothetical protein